MLNILKNFFDNKDSDKSDINKNLELLCGLMIEAANTDGEIDQNEKEKINSVLVDVFNESPDEVINVLNKAIENRDNSKSLHFYTSKINKEYSEEKKLLLLQILWEIVLSDGKLHDYESSLIRRLSGLLYISDVSSGNARKRVLDKLRNKSWLI